MTFTHKLTGETLKAVAVTTGGVTFENQNGETRYLTNHQIARLLKR